MKIEPIGSQPSSKRSTDWFTGTVRIDPLFQAPAPALVSGASVTLSRERVRAGHTHPHGQTLIVTAGCGWVQRSYTDGHHSYRNSGTIRQQGRGLDGARRRRTIAAVNPDSN